VEYTFLIADDVPANIQDILDVMEGFPEFVCVGTASSKDEAIDKILEFKPSLVFLEVAPGSKKSDLSLSVVKELYQFLDVLPKFVVVTASAAHALDAISAGVFDYIIRPAAVSPMRKTLFKFIKANAAARGNQPFQYVKSHDEPIIQADDAKNDTADVKTVAEESYTSPVADTTTICIKSYGDYQFIPVNEIVYLKADNNTTDFILQNGRKLTAYKTLKHYEVSLPFFFFRVHNSYIVNSNHVSRINTGKSLVYLNGGDVSISFSKTFKDNIDTLIKLIAPEYL
jgi:two-component system, LytTR family, response regulator